jgi:hypothetical protein
MQVYSFHFNSFFSEHSKEQLSVRWGRNDIAQILESQYNLVDEVPDQLIDEATKRFLQLNP